MMKKVLGWTLSIICFIATVGIAGYLLSMGSGIANLAGVIMIPVTVVVFINLSKFILKHV